MNLITACRGDVIDSIIENSEVFKEIWEETKLQLDIKSRIDGVKAKMS